MGVIANSVPPALAPYFVDAVFLAGSMAWPATYADLQETPEIVVRFVVAIRRANAAKSKADRTLDATP